MILRKMFAMIPMNKKKKKTNDWHKNDLQIDSLISNNFTFFVLLKREFHTKKIHLYLGGRPKKKENQFAFDSLVLVLVRENTLSCSNDTLWWIFFFRSFPPYSFSPGYWLFMILQCVEYSPYMLPLIIEQWLLCVCMYVWIILMKKKLEYK